MNKKEVDWLEQVRYMISDAANIAAVESHVLRYWEDELELTVPRNELGHRYYTQENVDQFLRIKQLKEEGYQLKAIKMLLHQEDQDGISPQQPQAEHMAKPTKEQPMSLPEQPHLKPQMKPQMTPQIKSVAEQTQMSPQERMEQFQDLMTRIVRNAMTENNKDLSKEIGTDVGDRVLKEMNYLMRVQDEQEEERFKKLDEAIRSYGKRQKRSFHQKKTRKQKLKTAPGLES